MTKHQHRTAKKLALPLIAMAMLTTMMAVASVSRAQPRSLQPTARPTAQATSEARPAHVQQRTASPLRPR
jgi:hypothetical protein